MPRIWSVLLFTSEYLGQFHFSKNHTYYNLFVY